MKTRFVLCAVATACFCAQASAQPAKAPAPTPRQGEARQTGVEIIAKLQDQPTHIARTTDGRIFTVMYQSISGKSSLVEVQKDGKLSAYPDEKWNAGRQADGTGFSEIVGLKSGRNGWLGIVDGGDLTNPPRVILWDTAANKMIASKELPGVTRPPGSQRFVQDLAIDVPHKCIYTVATSPDAKSATVLVFDFGANQLRTFTILKGDTPEMAVSAGKTDLRDTASLRNGKNVPVAIDPSYKWVYMAAIGGDNIYRVDSAILSDPQLNSDDLLKKMEKYGTKSLATHIVADDAGNVYCAEPGTSKIGMFSSDRKYRVFLDDSILYYPYDMALSKEGYLYVSVNQVQRLKEKGKVSVDRERPFLIVRAKALPTQ
jgi:hypothetical protein